VVRLRAFRKRQVGDWLEVCAESVAAFLVSTCEMACYGYVRLAAQDPGRGSGSGFLLRYWCSCGSHSGRFCPLIGSLHGRNRHYARLWIYGFLTSFSYTEEVAGSRPVAPTPESPKGGPAPLVVSFGSLAISLGVSITALGAVRRCLPP
jgi:hypothetical protein